MADIRGVGKKITYSEDNPISNEIEALRKSRDDVKRPPKDDEERERLARWLAHRGRDEEEQRDEQPERRAARERARRAHGATHDAAARRLQPESRERQARYRSVPVCDELRSTAFVRAVGYHCCLYEHADRQRAGLHRYR